MPGRLVGAPAAARAGRLGVRVRQRQLPRHRRHRRGRPRAAPRRATPSPTGCEAAVDRGVALDARHAVAATAAGARSTPTTPARCPTQLPFCDFGEVIDPPSRRRHRARGRDARRRGPSRRSAPPGAASRGCCAEQEADGSWFGRWGANHVYGTGRRRAGARRRRASPGDAPADPARGRAGWSGTRTPTAAGARTCAPTPTRAGSGAARRPRRRRRGRCSRCSRPASATTAVERGVAWLVDTQRADGDWDEP